MNDATPWALGVLVVRRVAAQAAPKLRLFGAEAVASQKARGPDHLVVAMHQPAAGEAVELGGQVLFSSQAVVVDLKLVLKLYNNMFLIKAN